VPDAPRLLAIPLSPWSLRARWALEHHRRAYRFEAYTPMLGEPLLRARLGFPSGTVSVPVLFYGALRMGPLSERKAIAGSMQIARHAEEDSSAAPLFPTGHDEAIHRWDAIAEAIAAAGRRLSTARMLRDERAIEESVPKALRSVPLSRSLARQVVSYVGDKYGAESAREDDDRRALRHGLDRVRERVLEHRHLIGDSLSYAELAIVTALQFVRPASALVRLGPGIQQAWTETVMAHEYQDVLGWRDRILAAHPWRTPRA